MCNCPSVLRPPLPSVAVCPSVQLPPLPCVALCSYSCSPRQRSVSHGLPYVTRNTPTSVFPKTSSVGHLLNAAVKLATTMVNEQEATAGRHSRRGNQKNDMGRLETNCRGLCNGFNDASGAGPSSARLVTDHSPQKPGSIPDQSILDLW